MSNVESCRRLEGREVNSVVFRISWDEFQIMINPPPPPKPPTPHKEMLAVTPFAVKKEATKNNNTIVAVREEKPDPEPSPGEAEDKAGEQHSDDQKHKDKCNICQSKVVKPIVETDISRAASSFAKDSTLIKYSWRNEKATFTEKTVDVKTDKLPGHDHAADHIFVGLPEGKQKL